VAARLDHDHVLYVFMHQSFHDLKD